MSLRPVETNVVQSAQILAARQHLAVVECPPIFCQISSLSRREIQAIPLRRTRRPRKLRSDHAADPQRGCKVLPPVAQFDVISEIGDGIAVQRLQGLSLWCGPARSCADPTPRSCSGSGSVKKLNDVPQGQNSTSASGLMLRAVS